MRSLLFLAFMSLASAAHAQMTGAPAPRYPRDPGMPVAAAPAPLREIGFDQHLDEMLPLDLEFTDEQGRLVKLGDFFGERPVVLTFVYYDCPMLCSLVLNAMASSLKALSLDAAKDFEVVAVSFDPRETPALAAERKRVLLERYDRPAAADGWHLLTGPQPSIERLTRAAGFRFTWDEATKQFAHPAGIMVATPDGRLARYLFGLENGPRDLRFALVEASSGRIGSAVDSLLLYCFHYDPATGRYGFLVMRAVRIAGAATVLLIGAFITVMIRRERQHAVPPSRIPDS